MRQELQVIVYLRHPNITTVMGAVLEKNHEPLLVMEFMHVYSPLPNCHWLIASRVVDIGRFAGNRPKKGANMGSWPAIGRVEFVIFMCVRVVQCA